MRLTFDPMTIEHLGFKMYSHLPNALAELVANAYDADATRVRVVLSDTPEPTVTVHDDGHGMSPDDLEHKYLRIGRNRIRAGDSLSESGRRRVAGKKGLGKLALFGIGLQVTVRTKRRNSDSWTVITMDWNEMLSASGVYEPKTWADPGSADEHGASVTISSLKRKTPVQLKSLATSLSRLFNYVDAGFRLDVESVNGAIVEVTRELRYSDIEIETRWKVPDDLEDREELRHAPLIEGQIFASVRPLRQELRGVTLYVNGRLANDPEYFGVPESSYAFSYLTGYIDADYLDDLSEDVISTDRRSITWELPEPTALRNRLERILREVGRRRRETRRSAQRNRIKETLDVDADHWTGTIRGPESGAVGDVLEVLTSPDSDMSDDDRRSVVDGLRRIAPEYADLHWRHLHPSLQQACESEYRDGHYLAAVVEAIKRYVNDIRRISEFNDKDMAVLQRAFANEPGLDVLRPWLHLSLSPETQVNMRSCQRDLSVGLLSGFRNPIAHEERVILEGEGVFTYQDCLDALSILSHLRRRLDALDDGSQR